MLVQLLNDFPSLLTPLIADDSHPSVKQLFEVTDLDCHRRLFFGNDPNRLADIPNPIQRWAATNPSSSDQTRVYETVKELSQQYAIIRLCLEMDEKRTREAIIRIREILYDEKGLFGCRYGDEVIHGFEYFIYQVEPTDEGFLRRLVVTIQRWVE